MGVIYRALDLASNLPAAVKLMNATDPASVERFAREARVLAELQHPGIVGYLAHGTGAKGALYLAMEWLEGETLEARLVKRGLNVPESVAVVSRAAAALAAAHARR